MTKEIVFVYSGKSIPDYINSSLQLALAHSGMGITFIVNEKLGKKITESRVNLINLEDFYSSEKFQIASQRIVFEHQFRNGFWLKSFERFYILEQYMQSGKLQSIFHAELDQCLFRIDELIQQLETTEKKGLFVPFHSTKAAVASIMFCNELSALTSLNEFGLRKSFFLNEMMLIAEKASQESSGMYSLPTIASSFFQRSEIEPGSIENVDSSEINGFVDAAQIGQWIGGIDPRNIKVTSSPKNKYVDAPQPGLLNYEMLQSLSFRFDEENSRLIVKNSRFGDKQLYNIHLHSKAHTWLNKAKKNLPLLIKNSNLQATVVVPGLRKKQIVEFAKDRLAFIKENRTLIYGKIRKRFTRRFQFRRNTSPFISPGAFFASCDLDFKVYEAGFGSLSNTRAHKVFCRLSDLPNLVHLLSQRNSVVDVFVFESSGQELEYKTIDIMESIVRKTGGIQVLDFVRQSNYITLLPLGISNVEISLMKLKKMNRVSNLRRKDRIYKVLWSLNVEDYINGSSAKYLPFLDSKIGLRLDSFSDARFEASLLSYSFIALLVDGNDDIHRLWICIYCGCIPIVLRNSYVEKMQNQGVPIWIVDDFSEITTLDDDSLSVLYEKIQNDLSAKRIWMSDWTN